jgi:hypothetical protein
MRQWRELEPLLLSQRQRYHLPEPDLAAAMLVARCAERALSEDELWELSCRIKPSGRCD